MPDDTAGPPGSCDEPGRVWDPITQSCIEGPHEDCGPGKSWSWERFDRCWHTAKYSIPVLAGSDCRVPRNVMVDENGVASGGCVPQPCDDFYPANGAFGEPPWAWSTSALDCVPLAKPSGDQGSSPPNWRNAGVARYNPRMAKSSSTRPSSNWRNSGRHSRKVARVASPVSGTALAGGSRGQIYRRPAKGRAVPSNRLALAARFAHARSQKVYHDARRVLRGLR